MKLGGCSPGAHSLTLLWLAGLLEAEGTFLKPPPSEPNLPIVTCRMTDRDVIQRVAQLFGTEVCVIQRGRFLTQFSARLKGSRAVSLMRDLRPLMGVRRTEAIDVAVSLFRPPIRKLSYASAEDIRGEYTLGASVSELARAYEVSRPTIRSALTGRIYRRPAIRPWRNNTRWCPEVEVPDGCNRSDLCWLAGWLEGEGSFCAPPPSRPGSPRITACTRDRDIADHAAGLLGLSPIYRRHRRNPNWSPLWQFACTGRRAERFMKAVSPLMGERRRDQIKRALGAAQAEQRQRAWPVGP